MMTFDSAGHETCVVRETRTNTPLQALTLMNDVTFLEAARVVGQRMMTEGGATPAARIGFAYRLATARTASPRMSEALLDAFRHTLDRYQTNPEAAQKFVRVGESPLNEKLNVSELAAYSTVASLILNMDEAVTKE
jgi:flagellar biosynthesis regulator FlbT